MARRSRYFPCRIGMESSEMFYGEDLVSLRSLLLCEGKRKKKKLPREDAEAAKGKRRVNPMNLKYLPIIQEAPI